MRAMPRLAANLSFLFQEVPFLERFAAAARAGFRGVELLFPYAHPQAVLVDAVGASELEVAIFNMPPGDWDAGERGLACDPARIAEFREGVGQAIEYALALGCRQVHCMAGLRPPGIAEPLLRETYLANLAFAGRALARHGLGLLVEAINTRDMPGYYLTTPRQAFELMDAVAAPNLRFQFDVYHVQIMQGDLAPTLERHLDRIGHVQIADTPGRHEPGTGEINYRFLLQHLDRIGYQGWVGCEYRPSTTTEAGLGWAEAYLAARRPS